MNRPGTKQRARPCPPNTRRPPWFSINGTCAAWSRGRPKSPTVGFGGKVYNFMWGPSEFHLTGTLKDYERTPRLGELRLPVLYAAGRFDECTPEATAWYQSLTPNSRLEIFERSAHVPMLEEEERYLAVLRAFLREVERKL